jgi:hypothetical protein
MVVDDRSRHELYRRLEEVLGLEAATTLIEHLPPAGWAEVATKHDLANLEERLELRFDARFAAIDGRFDRVDERFNSIDERFNSLEERFEERFKGLDWRFEGLDDRLKGGMSELRAAFEHELRAQTNTVVFGLVSVVLTMAVLAFALARFT